MCYVISYAFACLLVLALCYASGEADDQTEETYEKLKQEDERNATHKKWNH